MLLYPTRKIEKAFAFEFLVARTQLYKPLCRSVGWSLRWSVAVHEACNLWQSALFFCLLIKPSVCPPFKSRARNSKAALLVCPLIYPSVGWSLIARSTRLTAIGLVRPQTSPNNPHGPRAGYHTALLGPRTSTGSPKTSLDGPLTPPAGLLILYLDLTPL